MICRRDYRISIMDKKNSNKRTFYTEIRENAEISAGIFSMNLAYPEDLTSEIIPGQFINLYLNRHDLLLPRPISICGVGRDRIRIVYGVVGQGTKELSVYSPGTRIRVSTPLGNGYDLSEHRFGGNRGSAASNPIGKPPSAASNRANTKFALLVGGGIGIPPLLELAHRLDEINVSVTAVLGYRDEPFLHEDFYEAGARVYTATDGGKAGFKGSVLDLLRSWGSADMMGEYKAVPCFACGPTPMLKALTEFCREKGMDLQVSLEERMGCGFGACVGCVCKVHSSGGIVQKKVCKDGPVFSGEEVIWNG